MEGFPKKCVAKRTVPREPGSCPPTVLSGPHIPYEPFPGTTPPLGRGAGPPPLDTLTPLGILHAVPPSRPLPPEPPPLSATTPAQRRRAQRAQTRRAILDATEALLLEGGVENFSIRRLVGACGYTAPTVYQHFGDKDGLLDALLEEHFKRLERRLKRLPSDGDPVAVLRARALAYIRFGFKNPEDIRLLNSLRGRHAELPESTAGTRVLLERPWLELWEAGRLRAGDWRSAAQALGAICYGIMLGRMEAPDHDWSKTLAEDAIDALLRGLVIPDAEGNPR